MTKNMGGIDRIIRIIIAAVAAYLYFTETLTGTAGLVFLIVGGVLLATSFINFCPLYTIFGISTRKKA